MWVLATRIVTCSIIQNSTSIMAKSEKGVTPMTGRDLIIYILQNNLEDEEIIKEDAFVGFMNAREAAAKFGVGIATVMTWYYTGKLQGFKIGDSILFLESAQDPRKDETHE